MSATDKPSSLDMAVPSLTVDLDAVGRQHGHLLLPGSSASAAIQQLQIPISVFNGGKHEHTVVIVAGMHGDEPDGVLVAHRLSRELPLENFMGRLIILPALNLPALLRQQRGGQHDHGNLDLCFPGNANGSTGERLANAVLELVLKKADLVIDLRSGGNSLVFAPLAAVHDHRRSANAVFSRAESTMVAFGASNSVYLPAALADKGLASCLAAADIAYLLVETGGAGDIQAELNRQLEIGCRNALVESGVLNGERQLMASRTLRIRQDAGRVFAPVAGYLETVVRLGEEVHRGDPLAHIVDIGSSGSAVTTIDTPIGGILLARRAGCRVEAGDLIAWIADEIQP